MEKLVIKLKQHTPLIHFQHDQEGATLRASEVKPKLDRFILSKLGDGNYEAGAKIAKKNGWLVGKGDHPSLNYKMRIVSTKKDDSIVLNKHWNDRNQNFSTDNFPFLLANMGGKESEDELVNLVMHNEISVCFSALSSDLVNFINLNCEPFFALTTFGQRQTKGFGSFTVASKQVNDNEIINIEWNKEFKKYYENGTPILKFPLNPNDNNYKKQLMLFSVLDFYWRCLKSGINYPNRKAPRNGIGDAIILNAEKYIKSFLWIYLNQKGYTWEKRALKNNFHLETPFPPRNIKDNANQVSFGRGLLGCPEKYEYRIPQNKFRKKWDGRYSEETVSHTITIENEVIDRIASPIFFKPVIEENNVSVYILFAKDLINKIKNVSERNRSFKFLDERHNLLSIPIIPESIDYKELIKLFHFHVFTNEDFVKSTLGGYNRNTWCPANIKIYKDANNRTIRKWGDVDISWKMVPRNNRWENILAPNDNGMTKYVSFTQIVK